jgi:hypothetical protein
LRHAPNLEVIAMKDGKAANSVRLKAVRHSGYAVFQMAEAAVPSGLLHEILD